ncbi:acetylcholine receptor subunit alpha-like [Ruditapes philippinarum]|uniref:acetylcholine receptor subunit alpha-like n=1 Tax=Ruditapes philippinarum TaxID=129788 RepID=UPI00295AF5D9|nr:acetylcholine receptor subunit alpha-like [Ruditapes philippinarum]
MSNKCIVLDVYILFVLVFIHGVNCHSMDDAKRLLADKKQNYEKNFRPVANQSQPLQLYIGFELVTIQEFDEVKEQLTIAGIVTVYWVDEYMTWDPKDYGDLDQLVVESDNVWTPNLVLVNNVNKLEKIGDSWQLIRFLPNGLAHYYPGDVFSASCRVDVTYYPLDRHKCNFAFSPWAQFKTEINISPIGDKVQTSYFSENGAWTFYNSSISYSPEASYIDFNLYLERKPRFVIVNVILPVIFMAFLNTMIFAIPVESGERISYSITVLLAVAVFLTLVGDNLPKTSSPMSIFSYYVLIILITSIGITLVTILNVRVYYKNEKDPVPELIASFVRRLGCNCKNKDNKRKRIPSKSKTERRQTKRGQGSAQLYTDVETYINKTDISRHYNYYVPRENVRRPILNGRAPYQISSFSDTVESERSNEDKKENVVVNDSLVSWKDVSTALDKLFFILSFIIILTTTVIFFVYIYTSGKSDNFN